MKRIAFLTNAFADFNQWSATDKKIYDRIVKLIQDIDRNPFSGLGKPEPLKHESDYTKMEVPFIHVTIWIWTFFLSVLSSCHSSSYWNIPEYWYGKSVVDKSGPMRLLLQQEPQSPLAMVSLWVKLQCQSQEELAMLHLIEHLLLNDVREGATSPILFHAETGVDWMFFRCICLPRRLPQALECLMRVTRGPYWNEQKIVNSIKVITHELRREFQICKSGRELEQILPKLHRRYFIPRRLSLVLISPLDSFNTRQHVDPILKRHIERMDDVFDIQPKLKEEFESLSPMLLNIDGHLLGPGELLFIQMCPLYVREFLPTRENTGILWESGWQTGHDKSRIFFSALCASAPLRHEGENPFGSHDKNGGQALEILFTSLSNSLLKPPAPELFERFKREISKNYYLAHDGKERQNILLGRALQGEYIGDILCYPSLVRTAAPEDFHNWWRYYWYTSVKQTAIPEFLKTCDTPCLSPVPPKLDVVPCYPQPPIFFDIHHRYLSPSILAVSVNAHKQTNATLSLFLPKCSFSSHCTDHIHRILAKQITNLGGQMMWEDNDDFYLVTGMVWKYDFSKFLRNLDYALNHNMGKNDHEQISSPYDGKTWSYLAKKIGGDYRDSVLASLTVITLSGDFPCTFLDKQAQELQKSLGNVHLDVSTRSRPSENIFERLPVDIMGAVALPSHNKSEYEMLAVLLRQSLYRSLVIPGSVYHIGVYCRSMSHCEMLAIWVEVPDRCDCIELKIKDTLAALSSVNLTPLELEILREKAHVEVLFKRDSTLKREYARCQDIAMGSLYDWDKPITPEEFMELKRKYCDPKKWHFVTTPTQESSSLLGLNEVPPETQHGIRTPNKAPACSICLRENVERR